MKVTKTTSAISSWGHNNGRFSIDNFSQRAVYTVYGANGAEVGIVRSASSGRVAASSWWDVIDTYHGYKVLKSCFSFKQAKAWAQDDGNWFEAWIKSGDLKLTLEPSQELIDAVS